MPVHGYLTQREMARSDIAYFWRTTPDALRRISVRELRVMGEYMDRVLRARAEAIEAAKYGRPTPAPRGRPGPNDVIVEPGRERW